MKKERTFTHNKLLLLYFMNSVGIMLSEFQLTRFVTESEAMNYFDFKEALFELASNALCERIETKDGTFYRITDIGRQTLEFFQNDLRLSLRNDIDAYCLEHRRELSLETATFADYLRIRENEYRVTLRITEKYSTMFEVDVIVYSRGEAERICRDWKDNATVTYQSVIKHI